MSAWWRHVGLGGLAVGLALAPLGVGPGAGRLVVAAVATLALAVALPRSGSAWIVLLGLTAALLGLGLGGERLRAIDGGALHGSPGAGARLTGVVVAPPRLLHGQGRLELQAPGGRLAVTAPGWRIGDLGVGDEVAVTGRFTDPDPWFAGFLRRHGISAVLNAGSLEPTGGSRGGLAGRIDTARRRAERALGHGISEREAALARGFVLGQDDGIDPSTTENFRRAGLSHLLAVSGQNVVLLCLLAWPFLALLGLTVRARIAVLIGLITVYVPLAGAGPSVQRAGVMGAAGLVAGLAGRSASRWYALLLAAVTTLALNPRSSADVGWQLSFAAVLGLMALAPRLGALLGGGAGAGSARRAFADAAGATLAATLATAPLIALHFEALPLASIPANLLAMPAVAPAMWLGMLSAAAGQFSWMPVAPLNEVNALCLAYIEQVARWFAAPAWSVAGVRVTGVWALAAIYLALAAGLTLALRAAERRRGLARAKPAARSASRPAVAVALLIACVLGLALGPGSRDPGGADAGADAGLFHARFLDVGQGDSILLDPPGADPVLIDAGPPDGSAAEDLAALGIDRLAALVVTHDQADHAGGIPEILDRVEVGRLVYARAGRDLLGAAQAHGVQRIRVAEGSSLRSGGLSLDVLWPPRVLEAGPVDEPNDRAIVIAARWRHLSILLTADAEAEAVPYAPGPFDVLKVAHHGSDDAGLGRLLDLGVPDLAVISVGAGNSYGHPTAGTLGELGAHQIPVLRTDREGEVDLSADATRWWVDDD